MDGDYKVVSIDQSDLDELKNEIRKSKANFGGNCLVPPSKRGRALRL